MPCISPLPVHRRMPGSTMLRPQACALLAASSLRKRIRFRQCGRSQLVFTRLAVGNKYGNVPRRFALRLKIGGPGKIRRGAKAVASTGREQRATVHPGKDLHSHDPPIADNRRRR